MITEKKARFHSLGAAWADTITAHGRLLLTVLGGLAEFGRELIRIRTEGRSRAQQLGQRWADPRIPPRHRRSRPGSGGPRAQRLPNSHFNYVVRESAISRHTA